MDMKRYIRNVRRVKRDSGRLVCILIALVLLIGILPSPLLNVHAETLSVFNVRIDSAVEGNISVKLTNSANPAETQTQTVTGGVATFNDFVNTDNDYDIDITGMVKYLDYHRARVTLDSTGISYNATNFTEKTFSITTSHGENGSVSANETAIKYGENRTITADADTGYVISAFTVDGNRIPDAAGQKTYTHPFNGITQNYTVAVTFARETFEMTFTFNADGTIENGLTNPIVSGGKVTTAEGVSPSFTATANDNYHISSVDIDSVKQIDGFFDNTRTTYSRTFANISEEHTVKVTFAINTFKVTIDKGTNGVVSYNGQNDLSEITVNYNSEPSFAIAPNPGYKFSVSIDGIPDDNFQNISGSPDAIVYTMAPVTADKKISVSFDKIPDAGGNVNDYYSLVFSEEVIREEETATTITHFLPYDGNATLSPGVGYDVIKYNNGSYAKSFKFSSTTYIDREQTFAVAKVWNWLLFKSWKDDLHIGLPKSIHIVIDEDKPVVGDIPAQNWASTAVTISGTVTDPDSEAKPSSGISRVVWSKGTPMSEDEVRLEGTRSASISGSNWSFTVFGEHDSVTYYVYALDKAGNVSDAKTVVVKIDVTKPEITDINFQKIEPPIVSKIINFLTFGTFYNDEIEVIVSAKDSGVSSGLKEITLFSNDVAMETKSVSGNSATFKLRIADYSNNVISAIATDIAENDSVETKPTEVETNAESDIVSLKTEVPTISIVPTSSAQYVNGEENWYSGNVGFNVSVGTDSVGLYSVTIKVNGRNITTDKNGKAIDASFFESLTLMESFLVNTGCNPVDGENIIEVIAVNNCATEATASIKVYIDSTNPKVTAFNIDKENGDPLSKVLNFLTFGNFFNEQVRITVIADDRFGATSGMSTITLYADGGLIDGSPKSVTAVGDGTYKAEFVLPQNVLPDSKLMDVVLSAVATDNVTNITGKDAAHPDGVPVTPTVVNSDLKSDRLVIETINPVIGIESPNPTFVDSSGKKWYPNDVLFTVTANDEDAGIRSVQIKINNVNIPTDADGKSIDHTFYENETHKEIFKVNTNQGTRAGDGSYLIEVIVVDNAGNTYSVSDIVYKDIDSPEITGYRFIPATSDGIGETAMFIEHLEYGLYFKTEFTAVISVSDKGPSSGLDRISYRLVSYQNGKQTGETTGTQNVTDGMAPISIPKGFKGQMFVEGFDHTGNKSIEKTPRGFVIDDTLPEISIKNNTTTKYHDADGNKLYVSDMSFTVTVSDYGSGLREIGYSKSAEKDAFKRKSVVIENTGYKIGDDLGDGWMVSEMDSNLVTKATKTFSFTTDNNNIVLTFDVFDRSGNHKENVQTERVTVDKTNPIINVVFREDNDNDVYYNQNRVADITVTERNFNAKLIIVMIKNTFGSVPTYTFTKVSNSEYTAVINFGEGDYTFDVSGMDLGDHKATVNFKGGNEKLFYVDKTVPSIEENFSEFEKTNSSFKDENNSFNTDKTVNIKITEHHFDPSLVNLIVTKKDAGAEHSSKGMVDATSEIVSISEWADSGDVHTISFTFERDAIYQVEITPKDLAGNTARQSSTVVFEIDKTVPIVTQKNSSWVSEDDTEFLDVYMYSRKDDPKPTVEFDDLNIDHIEYDLTAYIPDHSDTDAITVVRPVKVYLDEDKDNSGNIAGSLFALPEFVKDGVYALELTAVDVAGNKSLLNLNTYARMIEQDVLAFIMESNLAAKTGLYSFQYENGEAISKRPDNFSDIKIFALAEKNTDIDIVLRDNNADEVYTYAQSTMDDSLYGFGIYNFVLESSFFKESFQDDTDVELHLTVKNQGNRIDLGTMHIDNIAPTCDVPKELDSWYWFFGEEERTITISNINELIDAEQCKVYDNGKEVDFKYLGADNAVSFTLGKGWHNVGVILDDVAGNANNIREQSNMYVGYFWLWMIITMSVASIMAIAFVVVRSIRKRRNLESE